MNRFLMKVSKFLAYLLRHHPEKFNLKLDKEGFTELSRVLEILNKRFPESGITLSTIQELIKKSKKKRYELRENKIRARYGHSIAEKIEMKELKAIPEVFYHGTTEKAYIKIKFEGLKKQKRQYVHLSLDEETAYNVGKRRTQNPVIVIIDAKLASKDGIKFFKSGETILTEFLEPKYLTRKDS